MRVVPHRLVRGREFERQRLAVLAAQEAAVEAATRSWLEAQLPGLGRRGWSERAREKALVARGQRRWTEEMVAEYIAAHGVERRAQLPPAVYAAGLRLGCLDRLLPRRVKGRAVGGKGRAKGVRAVRRAKGVVSFSDLE